MKTHARVVVIGGGVVGCSVLYHLTKMGWRDVVLCERKELTAGSSWHAAGGFHALNGDPAISKLQAYTISLYEEIERISGQSVGLHFTGGLNVAGSRERWEYLRADHARHKVLGLQTELISPSEIRELCPLMDTSEVQGAVYDAREGHLDPYGATHAFAKAAQLHGAQIYRHTRVQEVQSTGRGSWNVVTDRGNIEAEHVVNAGGLWAREVGQMAGVHLPLVPLEHHYLVTEDLPQIASLTRELPLVIDLDGEIYLRQERRGVLLGVYEKEATLWSPRQTPWDYGEQDLLPPALDRLTDALARGFARFPGLTNAGIRRIVNGPFTFTPDGNPLVGPIRGVPNYWVACGVMAGFAQGGGVGLALAQWITAGETENDLFALDVARFGDYATAAYTAEKAREFYARRFQIAYPNEFWPAGRPSKTAPLYEVLKERKAVYGVSFGLEVPLYFSAGAEPAVEMPGLRRSNAFSHVAAECQAARTGVAVMDISSFAKYEVTGSRAAAALDRLLAGRLPGFGEMRLTPMLSPSGRVMGDLTTARLGDEAFLIFGSGYLQSWHMRWFAEHLGKDAVVRNASDDWLGLALVGPQSRALLARLTPEPVDQASFPFMRARRMDVARAPAIVARVSVTGELGYEVYVRAPFLNGLYTAVRAAGADLALSDMGIYALNALRMEKGFGIWSREFSPDYTPAMCGLSRFVTFDKGDFIGRDAALQDRETEPERKLVLLEVCVQDAEASGYEPIWCDDEMIGFVTSGAYGHTVGQSLAMGYIGSKYVQSNRPMQVTVLGTRTACRVLATPPIDPTGARMRS